MCKKKMLCTQASHNTSSQKYARMETLCRCRSATQWRVIATAAASLALTTMFPMRMC